ncbi:hypothetical protein KXW61_002557 [Aspergillus fumigatus]|nr:hypothetical protein KXV90_002953 [Aspergillus fumigatus]KAH2182479.1 hypothetical protein KXW61_002557 [Aspergillus fumigatus]
MNASSQPQLRRMRARTQNLVAVISTQIPNSGQETAWRIQPRSAPDASAIIKNCGAGHGGRSSVGVKIKGLGEGQVGGETELSAKDVPPLEDLAEFRGNDLQSFSAVVIISTFSGLGYDFGEKTPTREMILTGWIRRGMEVRCVSLKKRFRQ